VLSPDCGVCVGPAVGLSLGTLLAAPTDKQQSSSANSQAAAVGRFRSRPPPQDFTAWSTGDPKRGSAGGGLLELADFGGGGGDGESGEAATSIPEDWQPCTKQGQPVAAASADL